MSEHAGTEFETSLWANSNFAEEYRDNADHYIQERHELFRILKSFYRSFILKSAAVKVCDLGCGDGVLCHQLLQEDPATEATLVDGSAEMLNAAHARLANYPNVRFLQKSFEELMRSSTDLGLFDFSVSAFAIHHLVLPEKARLFQVVHDHLAGGGWFLNIDTVLPDEPAFTDWYYQVWQEWVDERDRKLGLKGEFRRIARKARKNPDNKLSSLEAQLEALRTVGFQNVECHYKNGLFVIYAGQKPA
jgi:tRNA (cmo5U34)-methyltransferase